MTEELLDSTREVIVRTKELNNKIKYAIALKQKHWRELQNIFAKIPGKRHVNEFISKICNHVFEQIACYGKKNSLPKSSLNFSF